jgi:molybdopterin-containing oxidoreductase family membrane subunit
MEDNKNQIEEDSIQLLNQFNEDLLPKRFGMAGKIWVSMLFIIFFIGLYFYIRQLNEGLIITGMRDYVSWGIYISTFVFFVAVSLVGSLISAVLYLLNISWRAPLTRISEIIAVAAIMFAGLIIIVDMGRPDRVFHLFIYGRIESPIIWDIIVVTTYLFISLLLLYFPLLPDIAYCRDHPGKIPKWQKKMYKMLSLGWKGDPGQFKIVKRAVAILSVLIIPVALSIHTVTSWLFATTYRPGWDSSNFGPYFVSGAFVVGSASVIAGMFVFRKFYSGYQNYITDKHFDRMGKLLALLCLVYLYFNINEYMVPGYKMKGEEAGYLHDLFLGNYAQMFWSVQILGMLMPILLLLFKFGRRPIPMFVISLFVITGAWFKRYLIVIPTMLHPLTPMQEVPEAWKHYSPTFPELAITLAAIAAVLLIITLFARFFPIMSSWEIAEERGIDHNTIYKHISSK